MAIDSDTEQMESTAETATVPATVGALLKAERKRQGFTARQVAERLHITMHYVRAIEADRYEKLPALVFARGYIKSYAGLLGIDEAGIMDLFDESGGRQRAETSVWRDRQSASGRRSRRSFALFQAMPWVLLALLAFALGFGALWTYNRFFAAAAPQSTPAPVGAGSAEFGAALQGVVERTESGAFGVSDPSPTGATQRYDVVTPGKDLLHISFSNETLVEVSGIDDNSLYRDLHQAGDSLHITGAAPFRVLLGDARSARVMLNGSEVPVQEQRRIDNSVLVVVGIQSL